MLDVHNLYPPCTVCHVESAVRADGRLPAMRDASRDLALPAGRHGGHRRCGAASARPTRVPAPHAGTGNERHGAGGWQPPPNGAQPRWRAPPRPACGRPTPARQRGGAVPPRAAPRGLPAAVLLQRRRWWRRPVVCCTVTPATAVTLCAENRLGVSPGSRWTMDLVGEGRGRPPARRRLDDLPLRPDD